MLGRSTKASAAQYRGKANNRGNGGAEEFSAFSASAAPGVINFNEVINAIN